MIHFDLATNSMAYFSDECPDLLDMAVFGNNCDLDIIDEGEIDNQANHSTDFDRYFGKYDDDFDEDDEQDDILAPAIR
jgi:hypothetical protein